MLPAVCQRRWTRRRVRRARALPMRGRMRWRSLEACMRTLRDEMPSRLILSTPPLASSPPTRAPRTPPPQSPLWPPRRHPLPQPPASQLADHCQTTRDRRHMHAPMPAQMALGTVLTTPPRRRRERRSPHTHWLPSHALGEAPLLNSTASCVLPRRMEVDSTHRLEAATPPRPPPPPPPSPLPSPALPPPPPPPLPRTCPLAPRHQWHSGWRRAHW